MATVTLMVAAIAIAAAHLAAANHPKPSTINLTIQNNFPAYNLTVQCDSNMEMHPDVHLVLPKDTYKLSFDANIEHRWVCTLRTKTTKLCSKALYSGTFILWQDHMPVPPMREPMCEDHGKCRWFADAHGLSLIRHPMTEPVHFYDWPAQQQQLQGHHC